MTDWGAINDRVAGVETGLDLEMPGNGGYNDAKIVEAVKKGALDRAALDRAALRILDLILGAQAALDARPGFTYNPAAHHELARRAAAESAVLLKNEGGLLPLSPGKSVALIGSFAKTPRYQGAGSSKINPLQLDNAHDALLAAGINLEYAEGYTLGPDQAAGDEDLIRKAAALAGKKDIAVVFIGLPDEYESEGFDRTALDMPAKHNRLIDAVIKANPNTVVVLQLGSPVLLPWRDKAPAILTAYLGGQSGGQALADILTGKHNPSGKLAETWPLSLEDTPSHHYFGGRKSVEYRESIFVGYRYYDTADKPVVFPFGHGLSYTSFTYSALQIQQNAAGEVTLSFTVTNTGKQAGALVSQVYVAKGNTGIFRPQKELKGFEKVFLKSGESKTLSIILDSRAFAYYNTALSHWTVEGGAYEVLIGSSSRDIQLRGTVELSGSSKESVAAALRDKAPVYFALPQKDLIVDDAAFEALLGRPLSSGQDAKPFDRNSTISEIQTTAAGKALAAQITAGMEKTFGGEKELQRLMNAMMADIPLRSLPMMSGGQMTPDMVDQIAADLNKK
jgi:beta-glucosidase